MKHCKIIILLVAVILLSGCIKSQNTMTINKDKSLILESEVLVSDKLKSYYDAYMKKEDINGTKLEEVSKNGYSGYKYSKKYSNIDDLSKNHNEEVKLNDIFENAEAGNNLFSVTKSFFKNTYSAKFKYEKESYDELEDDEIEEETDEIEYDENTEDEDMSDLNELANLASEYEMTFKVNLPYGSKEDNATSKSNGNKTLVWNLNTADEEEIMFTFVIYNLTNILLVLGGLVLLIIILIVILIIIKKKRETAPTLIYKEYDPSIEDKLYDGKSVIIDRSKPENSLEFTLPEEKTKDQIKIQDKGPQFYDSARFVDEELVFDNKKREKLDVPEIENINNKPQ